jgi:hypothetical protein
VVDRTILPSVELGPGGTQDEINPALSSHISGTQGLNEWYGTDVDYTLLGHDGESGIYKYFADINESGFIEYMAPIKLTETGIYKIKSYVRDKNRNDSELLVETIKVDKTKPTSPTMTVVPISWTNQFVTISKNTI